MKTVLIIVLMSLLALASTQYASERSHQFSLGHALEARHDVQIPSILSSAAKIAKQLPYVETLKLVEAIIRLKGKVAGHVWELIYDNAHIIAALRDTLISYLPALHKLTLNSIIALRKVLEYASTLFSHGSEHFGSHSW